MDINERLDFLKDREKKLIGLLDKAKDDSEWEIALQSDLREVQDEINLLENDEPDFSGSTDDR